MDDSDQLLHDEEVEIREEGEIHEDIRDHLAMQPYFSRTVPRAQRITGVNYPSWGVVVLSEDNCNMPDEVICIYLEGNEVILEMRIYNEKIGIPASERLNAADLTWSDDTDLDDVYAAIDQFLTICPKIYIWKDQMDRFRGILAEKNLPVGLDQLIEIEEEKKYQRNEIRVMPPDEFDKRWHWYTAWINNKSLIEKARAVARCFASLDLEEIEDDDEGEAREQEEEAKTDKERQPQADDLDAMGKDEIKQDSWMEEEDEAAGELEIMNESLAAGDLDDMVDEHLDDIADEHLDGMAEDRRKDTGVRNPTGDTDMANSRDGLNDEDDVSADLATMPSIGADEGDEIYKDEEEVPQMEMGMNASDSDVDVDSTQSASLSDVTWSTQFGDISIGSSSDLDLSSGSASSIRNVPEPFDELYGEFHTCMEDYMGDDAREKARPLEDRVRDDDRRRWGEKSYPPLIGVRSEVGDFGHLISSQFYSQKQQGLVKDWTTTPENDKEIRGQHYRTKYLQLHRFCKSMPNEEGTILPYGKKKLEIRYAAIDRLRPHRLHQANEDDDDETKATKVITRFSCRKCVEEDSGDVWTRDIILLLNGCGRNEQSNQYWPL